jgi:predicted Zn-dependent protease with MMP-like domain
MKNGPSLDVRLSDAAQSGGKLKPFEKRRRNRHGRGLRGELLPAHLPGNRTREERFEGWVSDSAERLHYLWGDPIEATQFVVADIPPNLEELVAAGGPAPLGSFTPAAPGRPAVVTVFRRPVEREADSKEELPELVHDVVVEQAAELLGMAPEAVDPSYGRTRS